MNALTLGTQLGGMGLHLTSSIRSASLLALLASAAISVSCSAEIPGVGDGDVDGAGGTPMDEGSGGTATGGDPGTSSGGSGAASGSGGDGGDATGGLDSGTGGVLGGSGGALGGSGGGPIIVPPNPGNELLAFPGAEGFGRLASGGRGGDVYHVTNLNDSGAGSFRDAVSQAGRIVVFDVGGVINIETRIVIKRDIYVAGQTAPGGGVTIYGNGVALNGDSGNNIVRYIRIRMGQGGDAKKDALAISEGQNYMFDHVSISWGRDGTLDVNGTGIDNLTFQNTIVSQGINSDNHSTGGLLQSGKWSMIRSLYIDNKTRNPKARGTHEVINSVFYNWGTNGYIMGDTSGLSECNVVGNYFIYGPSSSASSHITNTTPTFNVFGEDNWVDSNKDGLLNGELMSDYKTATLVASPFDYPAGVESKLSAAKALEYVLDNVGASIARDQVDEYLIDEVKSYGTKGKIINTEADNGIPGNVGTVAGGTAPTDTDRDGMPDSWETGRGLDSTTADDQGDDDSDGYTNVEEYLSCLVGEGDC